MAKQYLIHLENESATVTIEGQTYKDGDVFDLPAGWKYDAEFSAFIKRPSFSYETKRKTRDQMTGRWVESVDVKRISLPVVEA